MTLLAMLVGLIFPACGADGIAGLPMPQFIDMKRIERPSTPNTFLAGPADMKPVPDLVVGDHHQPAAALYETVRLTFGQQARTWLAAEFPAKMQLHYVVRNLD